jgi:4-hydroxy-tetrahydrodipicolinate synthase
MTLHTNNEYKMPVGIMQAPVTPMTEDFDVDYEILEKVVDFHTRTPRNTGVLALYNKAEPHALTIEERKRIAEVTNNTVAGRLPVIIHVGHPSTDVAVELAVHAQKVGAFGICCITPYYWSLTQEEILAHFERLLDAVDIAVMAYNNPRRIESGGLSTDLLLELIDRYPNFVGMKDASHAMDSFTEYCRVLQSARPDFAVMTGIEYLAGSVPVGGTGSFSACGAIAPTLTYDLWDAIQASKWDKAFELQHKASYIHQQFMDQYPSSLKIGMELMGRPVGPCRSPLPTGNDETRARVARVLEECGVLDNETHGW